MAASLPGEQDLAIPNDGLHVDPAWFEDVLRANGQDASIRSLSAEPVGIGLMGSNVRYCLDYSKSGSDLPDSLIGKFPSTSNKTVESEGVKRAYLQEVRFYQELARTTGDIVPAPWFAGIDEHTGRFAIILEDLSPLRPLTLADGCTLEDAEAAVLMAAKLHASHWQDELLEGLPWITGTKSRPAQVLPLDILRSSWDEFQRRFQGLVTPQQRQVGQRFLEVFSGWREGCGSPVCLAHRDFRLENVLFGAPGAPRKAAVVDWQLVAIDPPAIDVAFFLGTSLDENLRREGEALLLETYHQALVEQGVEDYPYSEFEQHYAWHSYWGINVAIGSMMFTATQEGDAMLLSMFRRQANLILDNGYLEIF